VNPKHRLYGLTRAIYRAIPRSVRNLAYPIAVQSVLLRRLRPEIWIVSGEERSSHLPLSVCIYAATTENRIYLQSLIFGSTFQAQFLGRTWLWNVFKKTPTAAEGCSVVIADVHERHLNLTGAGAGVVIPSWVRGYVDLPRPPEVMSRDSVKDIQRRIRRLRLEYEVMRDLKSFEYFYQNMYLPYSTGRYGDGAVLKTKEDIKADFDKGELILVKKQGEYISGILLTYDGELATMPYLGVRDGSWELVSEGAISSGYEFALQHLEGNGCRKLIFGQSRAFLKDGVLQFKKKYGHKIMGAGIHKFLTKVVCDTDATRALLQNNPFIIEDAGEFHGIVFLDGKLSTSQQTLEEIDKKLSQAGLSKLVVCSYLPGQIETRSDGEQEPLQLASSSRRSNHRHYEHMPRAEWTDLIGRLGKIGIETVVAIRADRRNQH
jgi:hypothetical protein